MRQPFLGVVLDRQLWAGSELKRLNRPNASSNRHSPTRNSSHAGGNSFVHLVVGLLASRLSGGAHVECVPLAYAIRARENLR